MKSFKQLLAQIMSKERRRAERQPSPVLGAHYWTGGSPAEHKVRDISSTGLFLLTEERWYPGTMLIMTLQNKEEAEDGQERSISVQSKAVRWDSDGVGMEFVVFDQRDPRRAQNALAGGADRQALDRFLKKFRPDTGTARIGPGLLTPNLPVGTSGQPPNEDPLASGAED